MNYFSASVAIFLIFAAMMMFSSQPKSPEQLKAAAELVAARQKCMAELMPLVEKSINRGDTLRAAKATCGV